MLTIAATLSVIHIGASCLPSDSILIRNVNIVDVEKGIVFKNRDVFLSDGRIAAIEEHPSRRKAESELDASGNYVIPGLWDMHVHFRSKKFSKQEMSDAERRRLVDENRALLSLYLSYGITGVYQMGGDLGLELLEWRRSIAEGRDLGPSLFMVGPKLEPGKAIFAGSQAILKKSDIRASISQLKKQGVDGVKLMALWAPHELLRQTIAVASNMGLRSSVHFREHYSAADYFDAGLSAVAHSENVLPGASKSFERLKTRLLDAALLPLKYKSIATEIYEDIDPETLHRVLERFRENGTAVMTTFLPLKVRAHPRLVDAVFIPGLEEVGPAMRSGLAKVAERTKSSPPSPFATAVYKATAAMLPLLEKHRVRMLVGTDSGLGNHAPGRIFHLEMEALQGAGLSPAYVLRSATIESAAFVGQSKVTGSVAVGKNADLVLLEGNPLDDIRHTRSITALVRSGCLLDRKTLLSLRSRSTRVAD